MGEPVLITDANGLPVIFNCFLAQISQKPSHLRDEESETGSKTVADTSWQYGYCLFQHLLIFEEYSSSPAIFRDISSAVPAKAA